MSLMPLFVLILQHSPSLIGFLFLTNLLSNILSMFISSIIIVQVFNPQITHIIFLQYFSHHKYGISILETIKLYNEL